MQKDEPPNETRDLLQDMYGPPRPEHVPVYVRRIGSRDDVWRGVAERTKGGLRREDLKEKVAKVDSKTGKVYKKVVSVRASDAAARNDNLSLRR